MRAVLLLLCSGLALGAQDPLDAVLKEPRIREASPEETTAPASTMAAATNRMTSPG